MIAAIRGNRASTRAQAALLSLFMAVSGLVIAGPKAHAAATYDVEVGRFFKETDHTKESLRFYPQTLKVYQGDSVRFKSGSFHSVTLLPLDSDPDAWASDNAGGAGKPWSLFSQDPDEGAGALKTNLRAVWPSRPCGWPGQAVCSFSGYDGETLHSGLALFPNGQSAETKQLDFTVTINSDPGEVVTVVDILHPAMRMTIEVVGAGEAASDPAAIAAASEARFAQDATAAKKLAKKFSNKDVVKKIKGKKYRFVWAGVEQDGVALRGFYPKTVTIRKGQGVRWMFNQNVYSSHTVTFPVKKGVSLAGSFPEFVCDPDGDEGTAPDTPGTTTAPYCTNVYQLELDVPQKFPGASGNGKYTAGKDFESSGVRGMGIATTTTPYSLLFTKASTKKGFSYMDLIYEIAHAPMRGKVIVKGAK